MSPFTDSLALVSVAAIKMAAFPCAVAGAEAVGPRARSADSSQRRCACTAYIDTLAVVM